MESSPVLMETKLPKPHDHTEDELPESHPLAFDDVFCDGCGAMLHASNNECMQTWFEIEKWNYCEKCFALMSGVVPVSVGPILTIREALDEEKDATPICDRCGVNKAMPPQSCPYSYEMRGIADDQYCTCCDGCRKQCAMDV